LITNQIQQRSIRPAEIGFAYSEIHAIVIIGPVGCLGERAILAPSKD